MRGIGSSKLCSEEKQITRLQKQHNFAWDKGGPYSGLPNLMESSNLLQLHDRSGFVEAVHLPDGQDVAAHQEVRAKTPLPPLNHLHNHCTQSAGHRGRASHPATACE